MKKTFTLPAPAGPRDPIGSLHYYQWLKANKVRDVRGTPTKLEYLKEQGFVPGVHRLGERQLRVLRAAEDVYFLREIKPTLAEKAERSSLPRRGQIIQWAATRGLHEYTLTGIPNVSEALILRYTGATNKDGMMQLANDLEFIHGYQVAHQPWDFETGEGGILTIHPRKSDK